MVKKACKGEAPAANPEAEQRNRLKSLAFSRKLLSRSPAKPVATVEPSRTVVRHQGRDVVKKGQRKNKFLFSLPGLLAPISGGRVGELACLSTGNPVLYLDFPQGRMKLFGTVVRPKNKYLTLQFSRSSKGVVCEDSFESMIVFSEAWWVGRKEDNPEEIRLDFPEEYNVDNSSDFDFGGGAGAAMGAKWETTSKQPKEFSERLTPNSESRDDLSDDSDLIRQEKIAIVPEETPVRHSARTAGKSLNYAESTSGEDSSDSAADKSGMMEEVQDENGGSVKITKVIMQNEDLASEISHSLEEYQLKKRFTRKHKDHHSGSSDEKTLGKQGTLVQATLSNLFSEAIRKSKGTAGGSSLSQDSSSKRPKNVSKKHTEKVKERNLENKMTKGSAKKSGIGSLAKKKQPQGQEDGDIEDVSSDSEEPDSDEEWTS